MLGVELVRRQSARAPMLRLCGQALLRFTRWHAGVVALPETDLHRIRLWARERVPEHLWDEVKVEADVSDRHVDIVEVRPPWDGVGEHTRFPIARLRYTQGDRRDGRSTGATATSKFHEYKRKRPTKNVQALLDHIETSGDPIFWG